MPFEEPLAFNVEWFDLSASLHRQFLLTFYESDSSVEMSEIKTRKMFLRRCPVPSSGLDKKDLFVGNTGAVSLSTSCSLKSTPKNFLEVCRKLECTTFSSIYLLHRRLKAGLQLLIT